MQGSKRGNILLLELLIVIAFFMLGAAILMQMFGKSRVLMMRSDALTRSVGRAASLADILMSEEDRSDLLSELGAQPTQDGYRLEEDDITYIVTFEEPDGTLPVREGQVKAWWGEEELLTLPLVQVPEAE